MNGQTSIDTTLVRDGDNTYRVLDADGFTLGWVEKWYERDSVNNTGVPRFAARPLGVHVHRYDCLSVSSAVAYIRGALGR